MTHVERETTEHITVRADTRPGVPDVMPVEVSIRKKSGDKPVIRVHAPGRRNPRPLTLDTPQELRALAHVAAEAYRALTEGMAEDG